MAYGDDHQSLRELHELAQENNKILRGLRRQARWAGFFSFVKWAIIIASIFGLYYQLEPHIDSLRNFYENFPSLDQALKNLENLPNLPR